MRLFREVWAKEASSWETPLVRHSLPLELSLDCRRLGSVILFSRVSFRKANPLVSSGPGFKRKNWLTCSLGSGQSTYSVCSSIIHQYLLCWFTYCESYKTCRSEQDQESSIRSRMSNTRENWKVAGCHTPSMGRFMTK
ncbi:hypothetical protein VTK56DRAFT_5382 [Thermocarpiscus australiensis]